jgi:hypothetical protein
LEILHLVGHGGGEILRFAEIAGKVVEQGGGNALLVFAG